MQGQSIRRAGTGAFMLAVLAATPVLAQPNVQSVRSFVTKVYFEGLPYGTARLYAADVLPELYDMLEDDRLEVYWPNIVGMIGYLGVRSSAERLLAFLYRQRGELTDNRFRAVLEVMPALGHVAATGEPAALEALIACTFRENWDNPAYQFGYTRYRGAVLGEVMGRKALQGLGISGHPEARARLVEMQVAGKAPSGWEDNVAQAMEWNLRVSESGIASLFRR